MTGRRAVIPLFLCFSPCGPLVSFGANGFPVQEYGLHTLAFVFHLVASVVLMQASVFLSQASVFLLQASDFHFVASGLL